MSGLRGSSGIQTLPSVRDLWFDTITADNAWDSSSSGLCSMARSAVLARLPENGVLQEDVKLGGILVLRPVARTDFDCFHCHFAAFERTILTPLSRLGKLAGSTTTNGAGASRLVVIRAWLCCSDASIVPPGTIVYSRPDMHHALILTAPG